MLPLNERLEIISKGKADGLRLYQLSSSIYSTMIFFNWFIGIAGGFISLALITSTMNTRSDSGAMIVGGAGLILLTTIIICAINYTAAVLFTHIAKVLVHILFANLASIQSQVE